MKLKHSCFTRRQFLNGLFGGWIAAFIGSLLYPVIKFVFPPYREPDKVLLPLSEFKNIELGAVKNFAWGAKPGYLKKVAEGNYIAFVAVCSHLGCTVTYRASEKKFFCACHSGWYDENGTNIGGPPPGPLRKLPVVLEGENIVVKREGAA